MQKYLFSLEKTSIFYIFKTIKKNTHTALQISSSFDRKTSDCPPHELAYIVILLSCHIDVGCQTASNFTILNSLSMMRLTDSHLESSTMSAFFCVGNTFICPNIC